MCVCVCVCIEHGKQVLIYLSTYLSSCYLVESKVENGNESRFLLLEGKYWQFFSCVVYDISNNYNLCRSVCLSIYNQICLNNIYIYIYIYVQTSLVKDHGSFLSYDTIMFSPVSLYQLIEKSPKVLFPTIFYHINWSSSEELCFCRYCLFLLSFRVKFILLEGFYCSLTKLVEAITCSQNIHYICIWI